MPRKSGGANVWAWLAAEPLGVEVARAGRVVTAKRRLEQTALSVANPDSTESALAWMNWIKSQTDAQLAAWIERHSSIDVPGYARGGLVTKDTLALVGEGGPELVGLPAGAQVFSPSVTRQMLGGANIQVGDIIVNEATRPGDTAKEVRRELTRVFEELAA